MGLLDTAAADAAAFLRDVDGGFGQAITVWDTFGVKLELRGFANRVGQQIDPGTGAMVSGDIVTVTLPIADLEAAKRGLPVGVSDGDGRPWRVAFADRGGVVTKFKVRETSPDKTLGLLVCFLEQWND